jgi:hypothetical protein
VATDRQMKETDKKFGEFTNRFGRMVEYMVMSNLLVKFKTLGFTFEVTTQNYEIVDAKQHLYGSGCLSRKRRQGYDCFT